MNRQSIIIRSPIVVLAVALFATIAGLLYMIRMQPNVAAQAPAVCRAAMVLDRSGSVGDENLDVMRAQIKQLFQFGPPSGLHDDNIQLAFWSFSSTVNPAENYDAPFNGFVSSKGVNNAFQASLSQLVSGGGTNYEQGFGYNGGVLNTHDNIDTVINAANIIVFMTDGVPNTPGSGDNNALARNVARAAVLKHRAAGKLIVGGIVGNASPGSLNYVINGADNNSTGLFHINSDYSGLGRTLSAIIGTQCDLVNPPPTAASYTLTPTVTSNDRVASGQTSANFSYNVNNSAASGSSDNVNWSVKQLLVARGQSVDPLYFGGSPYRDGYSCAKLVALVNGKANCSDVASGQRLFAAGNTSLDNDAAAATSVVLDDSWPVGTKVCMVLTLDKPTQDNSPVDRYSHATCLTVGKRPLVQVHGGDLRVGRHFVGDAAPVDDGSGNKPDPAVIATSVTPKSDGRTYGSWAEYGVFSPGLVTGFASLSGLEGGYESTLPNSQEFWSKLTFANTNNEYGLFTADDSGQGTVPDSATALLAGRSVTQDLTGVDTIAFNGNGVANGLYQKTSGNLIINGSVLEKGKTVIVDVPEGTVTISGNLSYNNGPYTDINQIPQLVIIAKTIAIKPNVTNVSAWLIANTASDGTVSTCDDPGILTSEVCNTLLTINGPIMARHLNLRRTGGAGAGGAAGDPAEIINLTGDSYLWAQNEGRSDVRAQTTFTTELPPYF